MNDGDGEGQGMKILSVVDLKEKFNKFKKLCCVIYERPLKLINWLLYKKGMFQKIRKKNQRTQKNPKELNRTQQRPKRDSRKTN